MKNGTQFLAANLKAFRSKRNYTQDEFSKLAGLARSTITNIESGEANPSLSKVIKIANALEVSVDQLISKPRAQIVLYKEEDLVKEIKGDSVEITKVFPEKIREISIDKVKIQPGHIFRGQAHLSGTKEYLTVLEGELEIAINKELFQVKKNQVLAFPGDVFHSYKNTGTKPLTYISFVVPIIDS